MVGHCITGGAKAKDEEKKIITKVESKPETPSEKLKKLKEFVESEVKHIIIC